MSQPIVTSLEAFPKKLSVIEKLPLEIRLKIYNLLLNAESVRQPPDQYLVRKYKFETAILSVNKQIYREAYDMLYHDNHFIVVSCKWEMIHTIMSNYEVAAIAGNRPNLVAKFKEHVLRLHMNLPGGRSQGDFANKKKRKVVESFLLVANELERFVRVLRISKVIMSVAMHKLSFRVEINSFGPPPLAVQRRVLEPFRRLNVGHQGLIMGGAVDPALKVSLQASMGPKVNWVRGVAWEMYDLILSIAKVGDEAFHGGKFDLARGKYGDCQGVWETATENNRQLINFEDEGFHKSCSQLLVVILANNSLAALRGKDYEDVLHRTEVMSLEVAGKPKAKSSLHHCRAIALAAQNDDRNALHHLIEAGKADPYNKAIQAHLGIMSKRLDVGKNTTNTIYSDKSINRLNELAEYPPPILTPSKFIAGERFLLRHFGYKGDMLEGIEEKAPVDMKAMKDYIQQIETQKANSKPDEFHSAWIGGGTKPSEGIGMLGPDGGVSLLNDILVRMGMR